MARVLENECILQMYEIKSLKLYLVHPQQESWDHYFSGAGFLYNLQGKRVCPGLNTFVKYILYIYFTCVNI